MTYNLFVFYTYIHIRNDTGKVFYVGKGHGDRAYNAGAARRNAHWINIAKKVGHRVEICARWKSEADALDHEVLLIASFRSMGHDLVNRTDGGEGASGAKRTDETRAKMSESLRNAWTRPERRQRASNAATPDARKKMSEASKAAWADPELRQKRIASIRSAFARAEYRDRLRASRLEIGSRPEVKRRQSEAAKDLWSDPVRREKMIEAQRRGAAKRVNRRKKEETREQTS